MFFNIHYITITITITIDLTIYNLMIDKMITTKGYFFKCT